MIDDDLANPTHSYDSESLSFRIGRRFEARLEFACRRARLVRVLANKRTYWNKHSDLHELASLQDNSLEGPKS
jgi:hypothetical protein